MKILKFLYISGCQIFHGMISKYFVFLKIKYFVNNGEIFPQS